MQSSKIIVKALLAILIYLVCVQIVFNVDSLRGDGASFFSNLSVIGNLLAVGLAAIIIRLVFWGPPEQLQGAYKKAKQIAARVYDAKVLLISFSIVSVLIASATLTGDRPQSTGCSFDGYCTYNESIRVYYGLSTKQYRRAYLNNPSGLVINTWGWDVGFGGDERTAQNSRDNRSGNEFRYGYRHQVNLGFMINDLIRGTLVLFLFLRVIQFIYHSVFKKTSARKK